MTVDGNTLSPFLTWFSSWGNVVFVLAQIIFWAAVGFAAVYAALAYGRLVDIKVNKHHRNEKNHKHDKDEKRHKDEKDQKGPKAPDAPKAPAPKAPDAPKAPEAPKAAESVIRIDEFVE